eukprot:gene1333-4514_t
METSQDGLGSTKQTGASYKGDNKNDHDNNGSSFSNNSEEEDKFYDDDDNIPLNQLMTLKTEPSTLFLPTPVVSVQKRTAKASPSKTNGKRQENKHDSDGHEDSNDESDDDIPLAKLGKLHKTTNMSNLSTRRNPDSLNGRPTKKAKQGNDCTNSRGEKGGTNSKKTSDKALVRLQSKHNEKRKKQRSNIKIKVEEDEEEEYNVPKVPKKSSVASKKQPKQAPSTSTKKNNKKEKKEDADLGSVSQESSTAASQKNERKRKKEKKQEEEEHIHRWWEEKELPEGQQWRTLEHCGPYFPPPYQPLPEDVHFVYDGKPFKLNERAEEVATFYAAMLERDYVKKDLFNKNFFEDWKTTMTAQEKKQISSLKKCDFTRIQSYLKSRSEANKNASKEEKQKKKEENEKLKQEFGYAVIDGRRVAIGNFKIEPPGLFQGRGEHPKMGKLKQRVVPEQVTINIGRDAKIPSAPDGHRWREVRHDSTVTWLASWTENVQNTTKYVMLAQDSHIKGRTDWKKYETARQLHKCVDQIRQNYTNELKSKLMLERQRATALYFIDKLALRAGGEKDPEEQADTVGCCSLRVEHVRRLPENKLVFDFLGKDCIRYYNEVQVEYGIWKNIGHFQKNKNEGDQLFDLLTASSLNEYLRELLPGLTAKVFRTYNASITLQEQLKVTPVDGSIEEKMLAYQRANRQVAILCNHQRSAPKTHGQQIERLDTAIEKIKDEIKEAKKEYKQLKKEAKSMDEPTKKIRSRVEKLKRQIDRLEIRLKKKNIAKIDKEENKTIALSTSKLNYLDPRISIAWCKKHNVPIEKVYNATQRKKFRWAAEMASPEFIF